MGEPGGCYGVRAWSGGQEAGGVESGSRCWRESGCEGVAGDSRHGVHLAADLGCHIAGVVNRINLTGACSFVGTYHGCVLSRHAMVALCRDIQWLRCVETFHGCVVSDKPWLSVEVACHDPKAPRTDRGGMLHLRGRERPAAADLSPRSTRLGPPWAGAWQSCCMAVLEASHCTHVAAGGYGQQAA